jgi:hypothetical protein
MAWPTREDGVPNKGTSIQQQSHATGGMPGNVHHNDLFAPHFDFHAINQRKVAFNAKGAGVIRMKAKRRTGSLAESLQRTGVVRMPMRQQDAPDRCATRFGQDPLGVSTWINDNHLSRGGTAQQIAVHRPGSYFETKQFEIHDVTLLTIGLC